MLSTNELRQPISPSLTKILLQYHVRELHLNRRIQVDQPMNKQRTGVRECLWRRSSALEVKVQQLWVVIEGVRVKYVAVVPHPNIDPCINVVA